MLHIEKAEYCSDYKIKVSFNDGFVGIADFENTINNDSLFIIQQLKDMNLFKTYLKSATGSRANPFPIRSRYRIRVLRITVGRIR